MNIPRIIITIEGGAVQDITADQPVHVIVYDCDLRQEPGAESMMIYNGAVDTVGPDVYAATLATVKQGEAEFKADQADCAAAEAQMQREEG